MTWAWTLIPQTLAQTGPTARPFSDWKELLAVVLLGVGFILLLGTLGAMWRGRWRDPKRESFSSRLDQPTSLELDSPATEASVTPPPVLLRPERLEPVGQIAAANVAHNPEPVVKPQRAVEAAIATVPAPTPTIAEAQQLLDTMNAAEDLSTRLGSQLEAKATELRSLIAQAHAATEELNRARALAVSEIQSATASLHAARPVTLSPASTPVPVAPIEPVSPVVTVARTTPSLAATAAAVHSGGTQRRAAAPRPTTPTLLADDPTGPDPLTGEIYRLADQGMTPMEIARRMNQHVGKVELILALRPS